MLDCVLPDQKKGVVGTVQYEGQLSIFNTVHMSMRDDTLLVCQSSGWHAFRLIQGIGLKRCIGLLHMRLGRWHAGLMVCLLAPTRFYICGSGNPIRSFAVRHALNAASRSAAPIETDRSENEGKRTVETVAWKVER